MVDRLAKKIKFAYQEDGSDEVVDVVSERQGQHWHSHEIELSSRFLNEEIILGTRLFGPTFMFEDFELFFEQNVNFSLRIFETFRFFDFFRSPRHLGIRWGCYHILKH